MTKAFPDKEKSKAQRWLDEVTASQVTGTYVDPKTARTTVAEWCSTWLAGYAIRRPRTVRQARVHVAQIARQLHLGAARLFRELGLSDAGKRCPAADTVVLGHASTPSIMLSTAVPLT